MTLNFNVTGNERKRLVQTVAQHLDEKAEYLGAPSFAYKAGEFTIGKNGGLSWEDRFKDPVQLDRVSDVIDACVMAGFEPAEWEHNTEDGPEETELIIELPADSFTEQQLENLRKITEAKAPLIMAALGTDSLPIEVRDGKVTFPWFRGLPDAEHCSAYTKLVIALADFAKAAKRVNAKEKETDNPKYAFRCFLLRLGFIGDEYRTDRKILLENLKGSSAFRSSEKKGGDR